MINARLKIDRVVETKYKILQRNWKFLIRAILLAKLFPVKFVVEIL